MQWLVFGGSESIPNRRKVLVYWQYWFHNSLCICLFQGFKNDFLIKMFCMVISIGLDYLRAKGQSSFLH